MGITNKFFLYVIENYKLKQTERFITDLKNEFPRVFSEGLRLCTKTEVKFELKENVKPVFRTKRKVPLLTLDSINKELERLEIISVISKVDYSDCTSPTVYIKKKNGKMSVC